MGAVSQRFVDLVLPAAEELCAAIRGDPTVAHPLTRIAADFGRLYRRTAPDLDCARRCDRDEMVFAVDTWAASHLPVPRPDARAHTETVGAVIDRLARLQVHAWTLLMTVDNVADPQVHAAWHRLAELVDSYTDLNIGLSQRALRLPALGDRW
ncbi:DUF4254 domain-containing protein [Nocardia arizonensis]|uniref:DUF4254 domain-containing protein n=1 Tax=Nocardia arizonensis TaxID=1141647 RepID=UPI0006D09A62|nr:DUF4254 domain-containing protein [Nocardia arizonensis]